jgi:hypothetical protein
VADDLRHPLCVGRLPQRLSGTLVAHACKMHDATVDTRPAGMPAPVREARIRGPLAGTAGALLRTTDGLPTGGAMRHTI